MVFELYDYGDELFCPGWFVLKNKTQYYLIPSSLAVPINIGLNMLLIPRYGMTGAAISVVVAQITYTSVLTLMSGKFMKVNYEWNKILLVFVVGIAIFLGVNLIELPNIILQFLFKFLLLALFPVILYFLGFFEVIEIVNIKKSIRAFLSKLRGV
ncbi:MAG: hypothetical protein HC905_14980 [Bacteroidales bacterium]|nr:hypothetical protein [Bacteroidales bacterium]